MALSSETRLIVAVGSAYLCAKYTCSAYEKWAQKWEGDYQGKRPTSNN